MRSLLRNGRFAARSGQVLVALLAIALQVSTAGAVNERFLGNLQVGEHFEIGSAGKSAPRLLDSVDYSNVSNFLGTVMFVAPPDTTANRGARSW